MRAGLICVLFCLIPGLAGAGPWPREKGTTFVSTSVTATTPMGDIGSDLRAFGAFYAEHGLGRDLTLGFDAGMDADGGYSAILFLRRPVAPGAEPHRFSFQAGLGAVSEAGVDDILLHGGASWGRGIDTRFGAGWVTLDARIDYRIDAAAVATKADLTLGIKPDQRTKLMVQVQTGDYPGSGPYLRLAPSIARKFGERTHVELGARIGIAGDDRVGLKIGTWLEF